MKKWWIDDVEERVCARVDHPKVGLHNMPWPDCEKVHIVMLVSDHDKIIKERDELIKEAIPWVTCVKEISELPEYRQAMATKVLIEWLEKAEKLK